MVEYKNESNEKKPSKRIRKACKRKGINITETKVIRVYKPENKLKTLCKIKPRKRSSTYTRYTKQRFIRRRSQAPKRRKPENRRFIRRRSQAPKRIRKRTRVSLKPASANRRFAGTSTPKRIRKRTRVSLKPTYTPKRIRKRTSTPKRIKRREVRRRRTSTPKRIKRREVRRRRTSTPKRIRKRTRVSLKPASANRRFAGTYTPKRIRKRTSTPKRIKRREVRRRRTSTPKRIKRREVRRRGFIPPIKLLPPHQLRVMSSPRRRKTPPPIYIKKIETSPPHQLRVMSSPRRRKTPPPIYIKKIETSPPPIYIKKIETSPPPIYIKKVETSPPPKHRVMSSPRRRKTPPHKCSLQQFCKKIYKFSNTYDPYLNYKPPKQLDRTVHSLESELDRYRIQQQKLQEIIRMFKTQKIYDIKKIESVVKKVKRLEKEGEKWKELEGKLSNFNILKNKKLQQQNYKLTQLKQELINYTIEINKIFKIQQKLIQIESKIVKSLAQKKIDQNYNIENKWGNELKKMNTRKNEILDKILGAIAELLKVQKEKQNDDNGLFKLLNLPQQPFIPIPMPPLFDFKNKIKINEGINLQKEIKENASKELVKQGYTKENKQIENKIDNISFKAISQPQQLREQQRKLKQEKEEDRDSNLRRNFEYQEELNNNLLRSGRDELENADPERIELDKLNAEINNDIKYIGTKGLGDRLKEGSKNAIVVDEDNKLNNDNDNDRDKTTNKSTDGNDNDKTTDKSTTTDGNEKENDKIEKTLGDILDAINGLKTGDGANVATKLEEEAKTAGKNQNNINSELIQLVTTAILNNKQNNDPYIISIGGGGGPPGGSGGSNSTSNSNSSSNQGDPGNNSNPSQTGHTTNNYYSNTSGGGKYGNNGNSGNNNSNYQPNNNLGTSVDNNMYTKVSGPSARQSPISGSNQQQTTTGNINVRYTSRYKQPLDNETDKAITSINNLRKKLDIIEDDVGIIKNSLDEELERSVTDDVNLDELKTNFNILGDEIINKFKKKLNINSFKKFLTDQERIINRNNANSKYTREKGDTEFSKKLVIYKNINKNIKEKIKEIEKFKLQLFRKIVPKINNIKEVYKNMYDIFADTDIDHTKINNNILSITNDDCFNKISKYFNYSILPTNENRILNDGEYSEYPNNLLGVINILTDYPIKDEISLDKQKAIKNYSNNIIHEIRDLILYRSSLIDNTGETKKSKKSKKTIEEKVCKYEEVIRAIIKQENYNERDALISVIETNYGNSYEGEGDIKNLLNNLSTEQLDDLAFCDSTEFSKKLKIIVGNSDTDFAKDVIKFADNVEDQVKKNKEAEKKRKEKIEIECGNISIFSIFVISVSLLLISFIFLIFHVFAILLHIFKLSLSLF